MSFRGTTGSSQTIPAILKKKKKNPTSNGKNIENKKKKNPTCNGKTIECS